MAFLGQEEIVRSLQDRFRFVTLAVLIGLGIIVSRLFYLQVINGAQMRQFAEENRIKRVKVAAPRGMVFDRNGVLLLDNRPAFDLEIIPQYLASSKQAKETLQLLSSLIKVPTEDIQKILDKARGQPSFIPLKIKTDLSREEVALVEAWKMDMPGVQIQQEIKRTNTHGDIASHLLGYIGQVSSSELPTLQKQGLKYKLGDDIGKFGIEQKLEPLLRGIDGEKLVEVDAMGRLKLRATGSKMLSKEVEKPAVPGRNLVLTIDQDLQNTAVKAFGEKIGGAVAIDPHTGEILAMISRPSFDPTEFSRGIPAQLWSSLLKNENRPLGDKTIQDHYPPGSVFKIITAIAGLQEGVIDENTKFVCTGSIQVGNRAHHCWKKGGHGAIDVHDAIVKSCDVFFYRTAQKLRSVDQIAEWAFHMGLGKKTGIPLAREVPGLIPTEAWKKKRFNQPWTGGETLSVAIGQGAVLTTVLQLANTYASIANGGTQYRPNFLKRIETIDKKVLEEFKPEIVDRSLLSPKTYDIIKKGLWGVVNEPSGTMQAYKLPGMDFAGKTGTAQVISISKDKIYDNCESMRFRDRHHALFAGFAPVDDPKIAIAVIVEHGCHGNSGAGSVAREIVKAYLQKIDPAKYSDEAIKERLKGVTVEFPAQAGKPGEQDEDVRATDAESEVLRNGSGD